MNIHSSLTTRPINAAIWTACTLETMQPARSSLLMLSDSKCEVLISTPAKEVSINLDSLKSHFSNSIFLNLTLKKSAVTKRVSSNDTFSSFDSWNPEKFNSDSWNFICFMTDSSKLTPVILQLMNSTRCIDALLKSVFEKSQLMKRVSVKSAPSNSLSDKLLSLMTEPYDMSLLRSSALKRASIISTPSKIWSSSSCTDLYVTRSGSGIIFGCLMLISIPSLLLNLSESFHLNVIIIPTLIKVDVYG